MNAARPPALLPAGSADSKLVLPVVLGATFVQLLSVTIAQVAAPAIQRGLDAGPGEVQLVLAGYTLTYACLLITAARLGDRYGYRRLFAIGTAVFALASAACAFAPTPAALIAARLVQGAGSGLVAPQVLSIIQTAVPTGRRAHALGLYGATMGVASLAGPLLGGLLLGADLLGLGWRTVFLATVPVALAALAGARALPRSRPDRRLRIDAVGAILATTGFGMLILPLALGPNAGWPPWTLVSLGSSAFVLACFAAAQRRGEAPLIHPAALRSRTARTGILLVFVFNAGVPSFTFLLFLHLQQAAGYSALAAAALSTPFAAAAVVGSRCAPVLARRHGPRLLTASALVLAAVMAGLAPLLGTAPTLGAAPLLAAGGAAFGVFTASVFSLVLARTSAETTGSLSGLLPTAQQLGGSIGITLASLAYLAPAADSGGAFWHAMLYQAGVFTLTAVISLRLGRGSSAPTGA
ncbi:MFS transporter [Streptomonospora salina]|uniref:EmrB/QacA subfamily drug resistance transporter n=1 Tax=Streptomonospora salina TaxID=104205 RepID=A0A841E5D5_9ACTN|nr:MFS transporter [Streptomonospora salina]MBB5998355.1 EmrB/QacA subfamily drug resistance transporter [Streptomonospora salina]